MKKNTHVFLVSLFAVSLYACDDSAVGTTCLEDAGDCQDGIIQKECDTGSVICLNDSLKTCIDGKWKRTACEYGCNDDATDCKDDTACSNGDTICTNDIKKTCNDGIWEQNKCEFGCNAEKNDCADKPTETKDECTGTEVICENHTKKVCHNGTWQQTNCPDGCNKTGTDCAVPQTCNDNEIICTDGKLKKCQDNTWITTSDCGFGCNKSNTACAVCKEGSTCKDGLLTTCQNDTIKTTSCQYGCDSTGKKCDEIDQTQPTRYLMNSVHSPITPSVVERMKKIMAKNNSRYNNVFIEIGDSHYDYDNFMTCFSDQKPSMHITWGDHTNMQEVVTEFQKTKDSFGRDSVAARGGKSIREMYSSTYDGDCPSKDCIADEISAMNPRFALFGHGSNDLGNGAFTFYLSSTYPGYQWALENYYRQLNKAIDELENAGVIPLISGIAPCFMELSYINFMTSTNPPAINPQEHMRYAIPSFNAVSRGVAEARQLPWLDIYNIFYPLPDHGLTSDYTHCRYKAAYENTCDFSSSGVEYGCNARNIYTVEMLDRAWRAIIKGDNKLDPIEEPYRGKGTQADPYIITSIPFTHEGNTQNGENKINVYSACTNSTEQGPEIYYKMVLNERKYLRMFAVSATGVDVDLQVMKDGMDGNKCIVRTDILAHGYLDAGTYYIAVDTFGTDSTKAGQYLLGIVECSNRTNGSYSFDDKDVDEICRSKPLFDVKG